MATFAHILAATDFSEASRDALRVASTLAQDCGAALTIVHVCEIPGYVEPGPAAYDIVTPAVEAAQAELDELLRSVRQDCPAAKGLVKVGGATREILSAADEVKADLVVVGTHGRRGIAHAVMGSVAERIVRISRLPVLTVRSRP